MTRRLLYRPGPLCEVIRRNGDDPLRVLADDHLACFYVGEWYLAHRLAGSVTDPVAARIISDVALTERSAEH